MFERFTDRARRVLVLAQEEARLLNHNHIGTEHLLLGLIHEHEGIAAQAIAQMDISLEAVREKVKGVVVLSGGPRIVSSQFTPRAKKALELSLREALELGHNYIGTEHQLLGLIREGEGVGAQVLVNLGAGLDETRAVVLALLRDQRFTVDSPSVTERPPGPSGSWAVGTRKGLVGGGGGCSFCGRQPPETGQLFTSDNASICEHCVRQWSEQLGEDEGPDSD